MNADGTEAAVRRRRSRLAGPGGVILGLAIDHRDSMISALAAAGVSDAGRDLIRTIKTDVVAALADLATAVMIDHEYGRDVLEGGLVPATSALVMPLEAQGYEQAANGARTTLMPDFDPHVATTRYGADACKLLLPYRAGDDTVGWQEQVAGQAIANARAAGLPLVLEPVVYRRAGEAEDRYERGYADLVVSVTRRFADLQPDLLKLPFPAAPGTVRRDPEAAAAACRALHDACAGIPWVLLGGVEPLEDVERQVDIAIRAGAQGFLVGRSVWSPALTDDRSVRRATIEASVRPAFERLCAAASRLAGPG